MSWFYLILAGCFELGFTTCMKFSDNFTKLGPSLGFVVCAVLSFGLLNKAVTTIPLGTAYAIWTGIGAAGTALVGMLWFNDPANFLRLFFIVLLIGSVVGLKVVSAH